MNEVLLSSRAVYHFMFSNWRLCKSLWKTMQFTHFSMEIIICYFSFFSVPGATCKPSCLFLPRDPVILPENVTADTMDHRSKPTKVQVKEVEVLQLWKWNILVCLPRTVESTDLGLQFLQWTFPSYSPVSVGKLWVRSEYDCEQKKKNPTEKEVIFERA